MGGRSKRARSERRAARRAAPARWRCGRGCAQPCTRPRRPAPPAQRGRRTAERESLESRRKHTTSRAGHTAPSFRVQGNFSHQCFRHVHGEQLGVRAVRHDERSVHRVVRPRNVVGVDRFPGNLQLRGAVHERRAHGLRAVRFGEVLQAARGRAVVGGRGGQLAGVRGHVGGTPGDHPVPLKRESNPEEKLEEKRRSQRAAEVTEQY